MGHIKFDPNKSIIILDVALFGATSDKYRIVNLVMDTGASSTSITPDAILGLGYDLSNAKNDKPCITASGVIQSKVLTLSKLFAIGEVVKNIDVSIQEFPKELTNQNIHGLLGLDFLRHFNMNICFSSGFIDIQRF